MHLKNDINYSVIYPDFVVNLFFTLNQNFYELPNDISFCIKNILIFMHITTSIEHAKHTITHLNKFGMLYIGYYGILNESYLSKYFKPPKSNLEKASNKLLKYAIITKSLKYFKILKKSL